MFLAIVGFVTIAATVAVFAVKVMLELAGPLLGTRRPIGFFGGWFRAATVLVVTPILFFATIFVEMLVVSCLATLLPHGWA